MAGLLLAAGLAAPAWAAGPAESAADHVSSRILASRCSTEALAANDGDVDPICLRTLAPGDSRRAMQRAERDRGLLAAYRDVDTLFSMRDRQIADIAAQIELARRRMVALHRELEVLRMRAEIIGGPRAEEWMDQARSRALAILAEEELIRIRRSEQALVHQRFERDARRLRMLLSAQGVQPTAQLGSPGIPIDAAPGAAAAAAALQPLASPRSPDGPLARR
ncbi:MAG: hypothetical protein M9951_08325 [Burkholderiaceae bacterium]|nr:hypothetical protein [Burkholderiaceae bacterium]